MFGYDMTIEDDMSRRSKRNVAKEFAIAYHAQDVVPIEVKSESSKWMFEAEQ